MSRPSRAGSDGATSAAGDRPLWTCPRCGVMLVTRNLWHSCARTTLKDWKARMGPRARRLYGRFEEMIAACGEYQMAPARTRIAFLARVRFAGITALSERGMSCTLALPHPVRSRRFTKVEEVAPGWWVHRLRITDAGQLDAQLQGWLRRSHRWMGMQERLRHKRPQRHRERGPGTGRKGQPCSRGEDEASGAARRASSRRRRRSSAWRFQPRRR